MTEEKIEVLKNLLYQRGNIQDQLDGLEKVLDKEPNSLVFIVKQECVNQQFLLGQFGDHYGYLLDAYRKMKAEYEKELEGIQKKIDEL